MSHNKYICRAYFELDSIWCVYWEGVPEDNKHFLDKKCQEEAWQIMLEAVLCKIDVLTHSLDRTTKHTQWLREYLEYTS
jgi:hypothetical protein